MLTRRNIEKFFLIITVIFFFAKDWNVYSQDTLKMEVETLTRREIRQEERKQPPKKGDVYLITTPTIGYNPSYGFMFGAGASMSAYLGEPENTSISSAIVGLNLTTKNQIILNIRSTAFTKNNAWLFNGDWRYMKSSQPTYGLGTGPSSAKLASNNFVIKDILFSKPASEDQKMNFQFFRLYQTISKRYKKNLYFGIGYHLDVYTKVEDELLDLSDTVPVITSYYAYNFLNGFNQNKSMTSGFSLNATYDSRDNQNAPYSGQYATIVYKLNPMFIGSDRNSSTLYGEYRTYINLTKKHHNLLCFWLYGQYLVSGNLPYMNLPALGWDQYNRSGRGYVQGRFRGQDMIYAEIEFRKHILSTKNNPDFLGMVFFTNATTASNRDNKIDLFEYINPGAGLGLDIMLIKKSRTVLGLDYAWGSYGSSNFYVRINKAF